MSFKSINSRKVRTESKFAESAICFVQRSCYQSFVTFYEKLRKWIKFKMFNHRLLLKSDCQKMNSVDNLFKKLEWDGIF